MKVLTDSNIKDLPLIQKGKVREVYNLGENVLLLATDRISAFDVVMNEAVPEKGMVLNQISEYWFSKTKKIIPNHFLYSNIDDYPEELQKYAEILEGRSMIVKKAVPLPVEFIVRGYITGSAWKTYKVNREVNGVRLPEGLKEYARLPEPIFTPTTKESDGHDRPIKIEEYYEIVGKSDGEYLKAVAIELYKFAHKGLRNKGLVIADTKFEFGKTFDGSLILIDEALTPDSSRLWLKKDYEPGKKQMQFDKQILRDYLESIKWDKVPPAPELPPEIIEKTAESYKQAYKMITGLDWK